jgi:hypothetical protein
VVLQADPRDALFDLPETPPSTMADEMRTFYQETDLSDTIHDVVLSVSRRLDARTALGPFSLFLPFPDSIRVPCLFPAVQCTVGDVSLQITLLWSDTFHERSVVPDG